MEQLVLCLIWLGYFVLILTVSSICGLIGYFLGCLLGMCIAYLLYPLLGDAATFIIYLFVATGFCLGCMFGAVLTVSRIGKKRNAKSAD